MKKLYWRPKGVSRTVLLVVSALAMLAFVTVETVQTRKRQRYYREKLQAARLARKAFEILKAERLQRDPVIDPESDPALTGLVGLSMTPVTSATGSLSSKQTTLNPNFAAIVVTLLKQAGVERGDVVAVGCSGSFPGMNVTALAALHALGLQPILISSAASSQWGANNPKFLWLDMEKVLFERGVFPYRSAAATLGGIEDRALGMSDEARRILAEAIRANDVPMLSPRSFEESIEQRLEVYREKAGGRPVKAYINIGGGAISVGRKVGKNAFKEGLNFRPPIGTIPIDSVMTRFVEESIPVIHLIRSKKLAQRYGLPISPVIMPPPGDGGIFFREEYNPWLAGGFLLLMILCLYAFVRSDWGFRILNQARPQRKSGAPPEPMV